MLMKNRIVKFVVLVCCLCSMPGVVRAQLSVHQFDQLMKNILWIVFWTSEVRNW